MPELDIAIRPASEISRREYIAAINTAYSDYFVPIQLDDAGFGHLIARESIEIAASAAALLEGKVVGVGMLGLRGDRAWIGGMGVIPALRRKGIGRQIMHFLIGQAQGRGVLSILLEVITDNVGAHDLYKSLGFETTRKLLVLSRAPGALNDSFGRNGFAIRKERPQKLLGHLAALPGVPRCWQRDLDGYGPDLATASGYVAREKGLRQVIGAVIYNGSSPQIGLGDLAATSEKAGRALLAHLAQAMPATRMSYINVAEDDPMLPALEAAGFTTSLAQFEMIYRIK